MTNNSSKTMTKEFIELFGDGASRGNPGIGAWGSMATRNSHELLFEIAGVSPHTTNNKMELQAIIEGLKKLGDFNSSQKLCIYSDSSYVVNGIKIWRINWKKNNWKNSKKETVLNLDLWQALDTLIENIKIEWDVKWVKGHNGHPQNERCDQLANIAIDQYLNKENNL